MKRLDSDMLVSETPNKKVVIFVAVLVVVISFIPSIYFYKKYQDAQKLLRETSTTSRTEIQALVEKVGKVIELPAGEEPTVATVSDLERLKGQPFFARAKIGDKVLVFNNAKKAILYDPVANKIVEVGPVILPTPTETTATAAISPTVPLLTTTPSPAQTASFKVVLYNGTETVGLTKTVEQIIKEKAVNFEVIDKDYAQKRDYTKTLVIDLSANKKEAAEDLAKMVGAEISSLPAGETKPKEADFLIIVGRDKK